ncbi:hypothetical protein DDB_G0284351 [Dictyostelium discoideum AX4]|uniref:Uncharacterized protein n=1 Tax=Dictyostelium discoideum TaxID=44689 RepID=Q54PT0_DICDI|nr:hypothetical protein DDB_G0284351 [Dictyostelium discoideum AX4]EAL65224.1 hypothetical protein DDB_G0284351 [Dictyostelium discoideum AX4]|eukprot:XP_638574.1 hypothetical protein DDB_G0284351 [Dictyostelium discoideum AX4]
MDYSKKLCVITGASSGFGEALAKILSKSGYSLLLLARRIEKMQEFNLPNCICQKVDVTNYDEFEKAVREAESFFGCKTDLMVNNAGVMLLGHIWEQDMKDWDKTLDVNVKGVLHGCRIVLKDMMDRNGGTIINVSSIAGLDPYELHSVYGASKYGVHCISNTIRKEVAQKNVRVMIISPGIAETELLSHNKSNEKVFNTYNSWKDTLKGQSMNPYNVANSIKFMYEMPQEITIRDLIICPTKQE